MMLFVSKCIGFNTVSPHDLLEGLALQSTLAGGLGNVSLRICEHLGNIGVIESDQVLFLGLLIGQVLR